MAEILPHLKGPEDVRRLPPADLPRLAEEIRERIIETVSHNGGHLAPNLGVVELAISLHRVFKSPVDKIVWDTGHQSYPHKLLTGRGMEFHTLRRPGGLSGFCKRTESPHDIWEAGHAGTAISAALGMAMARDRLGRDHAVVAVVGDGALTAGMSFEALNNAGQAGSRLIVILNDNSMSIAPNVGAMSSYLTRLRAEPAYLRLKEDLTHAIERIPRVGPAMSRTAERVKDSIKQFILPGMLFEEWGFTYLGPVDGHHLPSLMEVLGNAKRIAGPVLVHVVTVKGKGYAPAEESPEVFHGIGAFKRKNGEAKPGGGVPTYTAVFSGALVELGSRHRDICAVTAAMPEGTGLKEFALRFPERFFDVGIAEQHAVTFAGGLAVAGLRPVVAVYSTFMQRSYDQILHDICLQKLPVVLAVDRAGLVGADGETHQGAFDLAYLRHIPNLTVAAPRDENELVRLLNFAVTHDGPVAIRYPRSRGEGVLIEDEPSLPIIGRGDVLRRGRDVAIIAVGPMVYRAMEAAEMLVAKGLEATVVDARFVRPLDVELIGEVARSTGAVLTLEEHSVRGGFGSAVAELLSEQGLPEVRLRIMGLPDRFITHGDREDLLSRFGLDARGIAIAASILAGGKSRRRISARRAARR